ncbi:MAG: hypothetical protein K5931_02685 [Lachnospiraceae bacterium]|nr:hypothetical protein [Lachnospiraceae bacterium]
MFSDRLTVLIQDLHANSIQIAYYSGFDRSNISRLKNGRRNPSSDSKTIKKLVKGIYLYAKDNEALLRLCKLTGADINSSNEQICNTVSAWLFKDDDNEKITVKKKSGTREKNSNRKNSSSAINSSLNLFCNRFNAVMNIAVLSNVKLSYLINVDPSLISRYRTGERSPKSNPRISGILSQTLYKRIERLDNLEELSKLMQCPVSEVKEESFFNWLYNADSIEATNISAVELLLESINTYDEIPALEPSLPIKDILPPDIARDITQYQGYEGLREAVLRFLSDALENHSPELLLYSDQNLQWIVDDPDFKAKWIALMVKCISSGIHIRIIHNIERGFEEMNTAIVSWMPLYASGMIRSYYNTISCGSRFSHTLFLNPGRECIEACHVIGTEAEGIYFYRSSPLELKFYQAEFEKLLSYSKNLVRISKEDKIDFPSEDTILIKDGLSAVTMSKETLKAYNRGLIPECHEKYSEEFFNLLNSHKIYECIMLSDDYSSNTEDSEQAALIYRSHIKDMIELLEKYPRYHVIILPDIPFRQLRLVVSDGSVTVTRLRGSLLSMNFSHPLLCSAFNTYAKRLIKQNELEREATIDILKKHIE